MNRFQIGSLVCCVIMTVQCFAAQGKQSSSILIPAKKYTPQKATISSKKGKSLFEQRKCSACHSIQTKGGCLAPPFDGVGSRRSREFIMSRFTAGDAQENKFARLYGKPELMPHLRIPAKESTLITDYLLTLSEPANGFEVSPHKSVAALDKSESNESTKRSQATAKLAQSIGRGKELFSKSGCAACHSVGSLGGQFAPKLDNIGSKLSKEAIINQMTSADLLTLLAPSEYHERGTVMPPMNLSAAEKEDIANFLKSLDGK